MTALCPPCSCNSIGSKSGLCNTHTGICDCLPGVDGFRCDTCQNFHWGFSTNGCQGKIFIVYSRIRIMLGITGKNSEEK